VKERGRVGWGTGGQPERGRERERASEIMAREPHLCDSCFCFAGRSDRKREWGATCALS